MDLADRMLTMMRESYERDVKCTACGKVYHQRVEDQATGFRIKDEDRCPYCNGLNGTSMSVEYTNSKQEV